jgi:hypothetical protein
MTAFEQRLHTQSMRNKLLTILIREPPEYGTGAAADTSPRPERRNYQ